MYGSKKRCIAILEEDKSYLSIISNLFKSKELLVYSYTEKESVYSLNSSQISDWDIFLADEKLVSFANFNLISELKKKKPSLYVIISSNSKNIDFTKELSAQGIDDFILKPIHFPQLKLSLQKALHSTDPKFSDLILNHEKKYKHKLNERIVGVDSTFLKALNLAKQVAKSKANIFISGENGTGKEVFARFIHQESFCSAGPFIAINCSAIPENLLESELFGHTKGAFTGANENRMGLFEEAENGTLFLDEIGDLNLTLQSKLLRVLQEKKIKRVGENQSRRVNCRIISATHKDLIKEINRDQFREDLYFRLNVIPIFIPPLRERKQDILPLAHAFLTKFSLENNSSIKEFSREAREYLLSNYWHGNVRELENTIERAVILAKGNEISPDCFIPNKMEETLLHGNYGQEEYEEKNDHWFMINCSHSLPSFEEIMNKYVEFAVHKNGGAKDKTARDIKIDRKTLYRRLQQISPNTQ